MFEINRRWNDQLLYRMHIIRCSKQLRKAILRGSGIENCRASLEGWKRNFRGIY